MSPLPHLPFRLADLPNRSVTRFALDPDAEARAAVADVLGIPAVRKLRFAGTLTPQGRRDWRLDAELGATVVQDCVVTLDPVSTRIDEAVVRLYLAEIDAPEAGEVEMPEDDTVDPLPASLDVAEVMIEALALALPPFPRADGVAPVDLTVTEPGLTPLREADIKPFAGLADLRDRLARKDDNEG
ncbi:MAG: DUF177 domain-containing protein [Rhodobacterales bacterium]|nr:DUF177 domain-containing protein [Rhodobacterales bacterium]